MEPVTLPTWDLADLYPNAQAADKDLAHATRAIEDFSAQYRGKITKLSASELGQAIASYEGISDLLNRLMSYAYLFYAENTKDPIRQKTFGDLNKKVTDISTALVFFTLEINQLEESFLEAAFSDPVVLKYKPWILDLRRMKPYQLEERLEELFHEKSLTGHSAWNRLFDETMASLTFDVSGKTLGLEETLHLLQDHNRETRKAASEALSQVLQSNIRLFTLITNTLAQDKAISDRWRKFPDVATSRHLDNRMEPEVVHALAEAVREAYPNLSHRYYALKARWMGLPRLAHYDRNAPLPEEEDRLIPWGEAKDIVLSAYRAFDGEMADIAELFFKKNWIDATMREGKAPGAFSHPTTPSAHPYILINYQGKQRDVMTLAHELGHGVHQFWAKEQGALLADTPLTLAETASVFGEMLTFNALLSQAKTSSERRVLIASKIEDMLNTVVRQIAFYHFERRVHEICRKEELTSERLGQIWCEIQSEALGPAIELQAGYEVFWAYIPHFIHAPFYVYAYAFGDCLVNALTARYEEMGAAFKPHYLSLLKAGGSKPYHELLAPLSLNPKEGFFWTMGLKKISNMIESLEGELNK